MTTNTRSSSSLSGYKSAEYRELITEGGDSDLFRDGEKKARCSPGEARVLLFTLGLVLTRSCDYVLYVRLAHGMSRFTWFLSAIILPIFFVLLSMPIAFYRYRQGKITPAMTAFPKKHFAVMSLLDASNGILGTIPAPFLPGSLQVVLSQSVIIFQMITNYSFLKTRYKWTHGAGVLAILVGVVIVLIPQFQAGGGASASFIWIIVFVLSNVPSAFSNAYKEAKLKGEEQLDVWYFNAWVGVFQLLFGIVTVPMVFNEYLSGGAPIAPSTLPQYLTEATQCFFGVNPTPADDCTENFAVFCFFIGLNLSFNILLLVVMQEASATLAVVASALRTALSGVLFTVCIIAGPACHALSINDIIALVVLMGGIAVYKLKPEEKLVDLDELDNAMMSGSLGSNTSRTRFYSSMNFGNMLMDPQLGTDNYVYEPGKLQGRDQDRIRSDYFTSLGLGRNNRRSAGVLNLQAE